MRRYNVSRLAREAASKFSAPPTEREIARRAMVLSFGPRTSAWILKQHRKQLHAKGVVDFVVPEKPNAVISEKLRWFFIAMDYLRQKDENGDRLRPQWDVDVFVAAKGKRTFRVRWLAWRSWKSANPFGAVVSEEGPWAPQWAKHAEGTWTKRTFDEETGEVEPAIISLTCKLCGKSQRVRCLTGNVKGWINRWASAHFHGNPLDAAQVRKQAEEAKARRESSSSSSDGRTDSSDPGTDVDPSS